MAIELKLLDAQLRILKERLDGAISTDAPGVLISVLLAQHILDTYSASVTVHPKGEGDEEGHLK